jgi:hypothetical protein
MALRRLPFVVAILAGVALLGIGVAKSSVDAGRAGDELVAGSAPVLSDAGLRQLRTDFNDAVATGHAFVEVGLPKMAALSGQTPDAFTAGLRSTAPGVEKGVEQLPAIEKQADGIITNLEKRQHEFESAKSLPGGGLSLRQGALAGLFLGGVLVIVGGLSLRRPRRAMALGLAVLGAVLVIGPLAMGYPGKTSDTDSLLDALRPFTVAKVEARSSSLATIETLMGDLRDKVIPAAADAAGITPAEVVAQLGQADRRLSAAAQRRADDAIAHFAELVQFSGDIQPLLIQTTKLPARATTWMLLLPGVALLVSGVVGAAADRRNPSEEV